MFLQPLEVFCDFVRVQILSDRFFKAQERQDEEDARAMRIRVQGNAFS